MKKHAKKTYLKEWRKHRGLTQEDVVSKLELLDDDDLLPKTAASLSRLENGRQQYSERIMDALASIYKVDVWELIGRKPGPDATIHDFARKLTDSQQIQAQAILEALVSTSSK